jgi:hypothetical protein
MKSERNPVQTRLLAAVLLMLTYALQAQFAFTTNNGAITITGYTGTNTTVIIPSTTNGYPVNRIGDYAFEYSVKASVPLLQTQIRLRCSGYEPDHSETKSQNRL